MQQFAFLQQHGGFPAHERFSAETGFGKTTGTHTPVCCCWWWWWRWWSLGRGMGRGRGRLQLGAATSTRGPAACLPLSAPGWLAGPVNIKRMLWALLPTRDACPSSASLPAFQPPDAPAVGAAATQGPCPAVPASSPSTLHPQAPAVAAAGSLSSSASFSSKIWKGGEREGRGG